MAGTSAGVSSLDSSEGVAVSLGYTLSETPVFAQAGTMLPTAPAPGASVCSSATAPPPGNRSCVV